MKICFNGWFSGFFEKTNPGLHVGFFLDLFSQVYQEPCDMGSFGESSVLCEFDMLLGCVSSVVDKKTWRHTYLFSGESTLKCDKNNYTCVLWGERNHANVINLPLFIPYMYCNNFLERLQENRGQENSAQRDAMPAKDVCVIVSNPRGLVRNTFLQKLEQVMRIDYAGGYKNNTNGCIPYAYNTPEFLHYVSQYKFIISMENSREDTYITEKIIHGLLAHTIPVYWGSARIYDYINQERILALVAENSEAEMDAVIQRMMEIRASPQAFLDMVNKPNFPASSGENKLERTLAIVARDIRCLLEAKCWKHISRIYCISNPAFEPERYVRLKKMFCDLNISADYVSYISPTYKHTITEKMYNTHIKEQLVFRLRNLQMKKAELSLFLNYKAVLADIEKNYKDNESLFFIFESDVMLGKDHTKMNKFLDFINTKKKEFDLIHVGMYDNRIWETPNFNSSTGYLNRIKYNDDKYIEDLSNVDSEFRLSRKFYTRCADSFLWTYKGIVDFLNYMKNIEMNYGVPFDYYMCNFFEKNINFKHYWSVDELFIQGSNLKLIKSEIQ
uniref:Fucosyltransferase C-terminal domain-containing protein n=1 Tax=viral metagenome TaxID=1070528 RepID=A0A6C0EUK4_9ZZZZ